MGTTIEWTDETWNPVTGCTKVSQGCKNCYAERIFKRPYPNREFTDVQIHPERLDAPLRWKKPRRIFVNSMSDLFHEAVPFVFIERVFDRMIRAPRHTFQILTKRPAAMAAFCHQINPSKFQHIHLGVSVEDQQTADERIPQLLQTPAAVRFVSAEPLLSPVDLSKWLRGNKYDRIREMLSCVRCHRSFRDRSTGSNMEITPDDRGGHNAILETTGRRDASGEIDIGRLSGSDVLGRQKETQGFCPSCRVDVPPKAGHSRRYADQPQERQAGGYRPSESGTGNTIAKRDPFVSRPGTQAESAKRGSERSSESNSRAGSPNPDARWKNGSDQDRHNVRSEAGHNFSNPSPQKLEPPSLNWVICGGESGPNARPMNPNWARSVRDQCQAAGVPFFFKQWGQYQGATYFKNKKDAGSLLDGREWKEFPGA